MLSLSRPMETEFRIFLFPFFYQFSPRVHTYIYIYVYTRSIEATKVTEKKEEEEKFWNDVEGRVGRRGWEGGRSVDLASFRKILGVVGKIAGRSTGWNIVNNYLVRQVVMRMLIRRRYVRRVARMIVGVRSGMVLMLGLRRERLGRRGRCPRPVVRPVAFIGAIHLQGRISSTRPEESLPPSTHGDTKDSDIDMATLIPGRIRDTLDSDSLSATSCCVPRSPAFEMLRGSLEIRRRHASSPFYFIFSSNFLAPNSSTFAPFRLFLPSSSRGGKAGRKKGLVLSDLYHSISLYYY